MGEAPLSDATNRAPAGGSPARRGALVVFEGCDRCGKTTQSQRLVEHLSSSGVAAELWRFPDRTTPLGTMIDAYLRSESELDDSAVHLMFAANRWEKAARMREALAAGTTLVVDRYSYSGVAFSAAKGMDPAWCRAPEVGLPRPDAVIYLDLSPEGAAARGGYGGERYERRDMQQRAAEAFAGMRQGWWAVVDASRGPDEVFKDVETEAARAVAAAKAGAPLGTMWGDEDE